MSKSKAVTVKRDETPETTPVKNEPVMTTNAFMTSTRKKEEEFKHKSPFNERKAGEVETLNVFEHALREVTLEVQGTCIVLDIKGIDEEGITRIRSFFDFLPVGKEAGTIITGMGEDLNYINPENIDFKERIWTPMKTPATMKLLWGSVKGKNRIVHISKV
jgi:hypothetical protein